MVTCANCGEEIIGKIYTRLKYKWLRKMIWPVKYCKYCYLETHDDHYGVPPPLVLAFVMISVCILLLIFSLS